jgi:monofunctional biosynthetic peptidoglycan transglycosylase
MDRSDIETSAIQSSDNPTVRSERAQRPDAPSAPTGPRPLWRRAVRWLTIALLSAASLVVVLTLLYRLVNPPISTLMLTDLVQGKLYSQTWVPLDRISPNVIKAVVMSEDAYYCEHWGVDWEAMQEAWKNGGRGASTIPMQTVKNVFLWPGRSYVRKAIELPLTYLATSVWGKRRTLEIYLNIAEWGPGIYGIEAAARHHFKTSAASLSAGQASLLAAALPNPIKRRAGAPNSRTQRHAAKVRRRIGGADEYLYCVLPGS